MTNKLSNAQAKVLEHAKKHIDAWDVIVVYDRDNNEEITITMEV